MGCDSQFDRPEINKPEFTKEEKITDVENKLDGKITFSNLQKAREKSKEAEDYYKQKTEEYHQADGKKIAAVRERDKARFKYNQAYSELDELISKWKSQ